MNQGFGKDFYRKGNSVTLKTEKLLSHPLPEISENELPPLRCGCSVSCTGAQDSSIF